ncbi:flocculation-associated PEP-CTERM protein PepA [Paucibacter sp. R3-3]|uniref:Flocculation-associated PEP-CTERM protein PepA n=1 Tax=Roseateles agri TaxID=3098619 RepID=A0ABU5DMS4_9BURK|nr:flocculation-associated PEP-CTERM protein PepA [Paucibacter sp. R3-3]MDY0747605.1 flocculation-associated PEP-CTERM protein PepA [Paucibacter sp. R3-3]
MNLKCRTQLPAVFRQTLLSIGLALASLSASALPSFTLDPSTIGLAGSAFTADNLLVSNFSTVLNGPAGAFTETGYLSVTGAQLGGGMAMAAGLNTGYGLYVQFAGAGHTTFGTDPTTGPTFGTLDSLTYTLYGYNGTATFGFDAGNMPMTTATGAIALASGMLVPGTGSVTTTPSAPLFAPSANAILTMDGTAGGAFFASPNPFMNQALTSFSNTSSQVSLINGGFTIRQGGGSINFSSAVPEPESYALLAAGLAVIAFVSTRRSRDRR